MTPSRWRAVVSPFFVSRHLLRRDVGDAVRRFSFSGRILDQGCGQKPYRSLFKSATEYTGIDFPAFSANKDGEQGCPDVLFDEDYVRTLSLPFESESFDHSVAFQVLEHHPDPRQMLSEMARVIKPGGLILLTMPFMGGLHEEPHDYQRLTPYGFAELLPQVGCEALWIKKQGSLASTIALLLHEQIDVTARRRGLWLALAVALHPFALIISYSSLLVDRFLTSEQIYFNTLVVARRLEEA